MLMIIYLNPLPPQYFKQVLKFVPAVNLKTSLNFYSAQTCYIPFWKK